VRTLPLHRRDIPVSTLVLGCMGFGGKDWFDQGPLTAEQIKQGREAVDAALSIGINMFDHANIYKSGKAEQVFGEILKEQKSLRDKIFIQSKCGIRFADDKAPFTRFDFSEENILQTVEGSLSRLGTDYMDFLLLHRPDPLVDPEEVASAFRKLKDAGKVRWFGVSNMSAAQMKLLQKYLDVPIVVNQLELSLYHHNWVDASINLNQAPAADDIFPEGTIEYCRMEDIQIQSWGSLAQGLYTGRALDNEPDTVKATAKKVQDYANQKGTTREAIVLAWLLKHPAGIQPVIGTTNPERIRACGEATRIELTREEWYDLWITARGKGMP
jgi:predicted oxidoreductase